MIQIDAGRHLEIIIYIIQSKFLALLFFVLASFFNFLIGLFLYVFPVYLLFTLVINQKKKWAVGLVLWYGISLLPMLFDTEIDTLQYIFGVLPILFLVIYCVVLNIKLKEWGYRQESSWFELWY